jgi:hypothetical protein
VTAAALCGVLVLVGALGARVASPLGLLNFALPQWLGVRLQAEFDRGAWLRGPRGRWWGADAPRHGPVRWTLLRWVWPLTGWWSGYRWIGGRLRGPR